MDSQRRIADFLDERTTRIDGLIAKKTRLLELLAEQHQALITRAVTRGLEPSAPMKPSGLIKKGGRFPEEVERVDGIGAQLVATVLEFPKSWPTQRLKYLATVVAGQSPDGAEVNSEGRGLPFLQGCAEFEHRHPTANRYCVAPPKMD